MSSHEMGGELAGTRDAWDDEEPLFTTFASGSGVITSRYRKTSLPAPGQVDMAAELVRIRRVLTALRAEDAILVEIAMDEARHQLAKMNPNPDKIGAALERAFDVASRDDGFDDRRDALAEPLRHACAWLGGPWHRLLGFVGLSF